MEGASLQVRIALAMALVALALTGCSGTRSEVVLGSGERAVSVAVEVADDPEERRRGLMGRESLGEGDGMLFVFESEGYHAFWMKNTTLPLDMIFISGDGRIVDVRSAQPCTVDPCESYAPRAPALYVLEVNQGFAEENGLGVGDVARVKI